MKESQDPGGGDDAPGARGSHRRGDAGVASRARRGCTVRAPRRRPRRRAFASVEIAKAREELLTDHEQELAERLEDAEEKLAAMIEYVGGKERRAGEEGDRTGDEDEQEGTFEMEKLEAKFMCGRLSRREVERRERRSRRRSREGTPRAEDRGAAKSRLTRPSPRSSQVEVEMEAADAAAAENSKPRRAPPGLSWSGREGAQG